MQLKHTITGIVLALYSIAGHAQEISLWLADYDKAACREADVLFNTTITCPDGVECIYAIDYGDKKIDTLESDKKPRHLYSVDGKYTVTIKMLKFADSSEIMSKTFNDCVTIYNPRGASIKSDTLNGKSYLLNFSVNGFKPSDTTVWRCTWTFHDSEPDPADSLSEVILKEYFQENLDPGYLVKLKIEMYKEPENAPGFNWADCFDTISEYIKVSDCFFDNALEPELKDREVRIYNFISPDGDPNNSNSVNEVFKIFTNGHDVFTLTIFNSYGNVVYTQTGKEIFWTGVTNSGRRVKSGTYYYAVESTASGKKHRDTGFVQVFNKDL